MERFTVGSEGLDLIFTQHFRHSSWASLSPASTGQQRGRETVRLGPALKFKNIDEVEKTVLGCKTERQR